LLLAHVAPLSVEAYNPFVPLIKPSLASAFPKAVVTSLEVLLVVDAH